MAKKPVQLWQVAPVSHLERTLIRFLAYAHRRTGIALRLMYRAHDDSNVTDTAEQEHSQVKDP